jgi:hypothetical protein
MKENAHVCLLLSISICPWSVIALQVPKEEDGQLVDWPMVINSLLDSQTVRGGAKPSPLFPSHSCLERAANYAVVDIDPIAEAYEMECSRRKLDKNPGCTEEGRRLVIQRRRRSRGFANEKRTVSSF